MLAIQDPLERFLAGIDLVVCFEAEIHGLAMALYRLLHQDEAIAAAFEERMASRREVLRRLLEPLAANGRLTDNWSLDEIVDILWEATAPSSYEHFICERGWCPDRFRDWIRRLARSFLVSP